MNALGKRCLPWLLALPCGLQAAPAAPLPAPIQALAQQGYEILGSFDAPGGLTGYAALYLSRPQTVYLTPDGQHAIAGAITDARGDKWNQAGLDRQFGAAMLRQLENSAWIADGDAKAPRAVYVFTDPNCPYCSQFWRDVRPWVDAGKVQLRHILVGILEADSPGKAMALLADADPAAALARHERQPGGGIKPLASPPRAAADKLAANHQLMERFGTFSTPAIFYLDATGELRKAQGAPSPASLAKIMNGE
ncbi:thiol:disulfide interchange protein DsbG [Chromobacterium subtsugae]|uniref:thiol:disulfide interchange protein DsbG n=1 Tax=Chromobacterium subtsugae TaxID=251747 RepID=UPI000640DF5C|nr:thiol:disulfide interchange protein DsbG [Chromobacterium subtsugae]